MRRPWFVTIGGRAMASINEHWSLRTSEVIQLDGACDSPLKGKAWIKRTERRKERKRVKSDRETLYEGIRFEKRLYLTVAVILRSGLKVGIKPSL